MSYTHLTADERFKIAHMHMAKFSMRLMAERINRSPSTINREVRRNKGNHSHYWHDWAQQYADERKSQPTCEKRKSHLPLYDLVINNIKAGLSPEIISGRLKREYRSTKMQISHETIYRWVVADSLQGGVLYLSLIRHHKRRRKQRRSVRRRLFEGRISIHKRPKVVADKVRFGDWESDSMEGGKSKGGLATHVERKSRYLVAGKLDNKLSDTFMTVSSSLFEAINPALIKTFTVDNGSEFTLKRVEKGANTHITVLDIALQKNIQDVKRLLEDGAMIDYVDHHQIGEPIEHPQLSTNIDLSADTCTSLIVDKQLLGQYRAWAITGAFGDNLTDKAMQLGLASGFSKEQLTPLQELGIVINYNGYGANVDDLFFDPATLYLRLARYDTPFEFLKEEQEIFHTLKTGYKSDMLKAEQSPVIHTTAYTSIIELPNEKWARRVSGVYGNELANKNPNKAHAIITKKDDNTYLVSVRAPLTRKSGADLLVSQFPTGGGRKAAAGINVVVH